jgi:hypothetical protein
MRTPATLAALVIPAALVFASPAGASRTTTPCTTTDGTTYECTETIGHLGTRSSVTSFEFGKCGDPSGFDVTVLGYSSVYKQRRSGKLVRITATDYDGERPVRVTVRIGSHRIIVRNFSKKYSVSLLWSIRC